MISHVDLVYEPILTIQPTALEADDRSCERLPQDYLRRMLRLESLLSRTWELLRLLLRLLSRTQQCRKSHRCHFEREVNSFQSRCKMILVITMLSEILQSTRVRQ